MPVTDVCHTSKGIVISSDADGASKAARRSDDRDRDGGGRDRRDRDDRDRSRSRDRRHRERDDEKPRSVSTFLKWGPIRSLSLPNLFPLPPST